MVGNYERSKVQDQQTIHKLKERMSQLELENTALTKSVGQVGNYDEEWRNLEATQLGELIVKLQGYLHDANQRTATPVLLEGKVHNYKWGQQKQLLLTYMYLYTYLLCWL